MTALLHRQVLAHLTGQRVTAYLTSGADVTGILSAVIDSGLKTQPLAVGIHLVDIEDDTPHDVAYLNLEHVAALAPCRNQTDRARGHKPTPQPNPRILVQTTSGPTSAIELAGDELLVDVTTTDPLRDHSGRVVIGPQVRAVTLVWKSPDGLETVEIESEHGDTLSITQNRSPLG